MAALAAAAATAAAAAAAVAHFTVDSGLPAVHY